MGKVGKKSTQQPRSLVVPMMLALQLSMIFVGPATASRYLRTMRAPAPSLGSGFQFGMPIKPHQSPKQQRDIADLLVLARAVS